MLGKEFEYIEEKEGKLFVGAATSSGKLLTYCKKNDIANLEFLAKLPGNIGGLAKMNAGLKEWEIFNYIDRIRTYKGYIKKEEIPYGYRKSGINDIIYEVVFDLKRGFDKESLENFIRMRENQPLEKSAGSCFKNPPGDYAGRIIEALGLKGERIGDAAFSKVHANFLVNLGSARYEDAISLISIAKKRAFEEFNVTLEEEIIIL